MATTNRRTTTSKKSRRSTGSSGSSGSSTNSSFATRTGKAIKERPATSAAIATGVVSGLVAAVAGFVAYKKSGKSLAEFSDDLATNAKTRIKDGIADAKTRAKDWSEPRKDGIDETRGQREIAEEALTTKQVGMTSRRPADPTVAKELKTGAVAD